MDVFVEAIHKEANRMIDEYWRINRDDKLELHEHESGPEIIAWLALGTAGLTITKSLVDLVTAIINARSKGRKKGDSADGKLLLIIRDTHRTENSTEEVVLEIYDKEIVSNKKVQQAIANGINKKFNRK